MSSSLLLTVGNDVLLEATKKYFPGKKIEAIQIGPVCWKIYESNDKKDIVTITPINFDHVVESILLDVSLAKQIFRKHLNIACFQLHYEGILGGKIFFEM